MQTCTVPRCADPSVGMVNGRWWPQCATHALAYAERAAGTARRELDDLRSRVGPIAGQDSLFEVGS